MKPLNIENSIIMGFYAQNNFWRGIINAEIKTFFLEGNMTVRNYQAKI